MKNVCINRAAGFLAALIILTGIAPEPYILRVIFLGDVMLGRGVEQAASRESDWQPFTALLPLTANADILAANLESPLTTAPMETHGYMLCASPWQGDALRAASFDLVTLANNHNMDCGQAGADQTQAVLRGLGIQYANSGTDIVFTENHRYRLAFLALDDISTPLNTARIRQALDDVTNRTDIVVVSIHWGGEYQPAPSNRQRSLSERLVAAGADAIIGHHPHVIQPIETLYRDGNTPPVPVFFSLGNAMFDQHGLPDTRMGKAAILDIGPGSTLRFSSRNFRIDPIHARISELLPSEE